MLRILIGYYKYIKRILLDIYVQIVKQIDLTEKTTVKISKFILQAMNDFITHNKEVLRDMGIVTKDDFIDEAVKQQMERLKQEIAKIPPYKHINAYEDRIVLEDIKTGEFIHIYFKNGKIFCNFCEDFTCKHIDHAWEIDSVRKMLAERGIKKK